MKKFLFILFASIACTTQKHDPDARISLAGEWQFKIDSIDQGVSEKWYKNFFVDTVSLPGSMAENGKGNNISLKTDWTGDIIDRSFFTEKKYDKYRQPGNFKVPFWLQPVKYYKGVAWYQKEIELPDDYSNKRMFLFLERPHWESTLFVNGQKAGRENSLAVAHQYDITDFLVKGKNRISIRMNNKVVVPVGVNSHSISDHTQSNWNGIAGDISIRTRSSVYIDDIRIFPDIKEKKAKIVVSVKNHSQS
jgi:beta-galactosidase/beta-glucuronidase